MTNSQLFTAAHKLAKTYEGDYVACFALALIELKETKTIDMKTSTFENGSIQLELIKVVDTTNDYGYTHLFSATFTEDGETDEVGINVNTNNNFSKWLQDNCDIEGTEENVELFKTMLK